MWLKISTTYKNGIINRWQSLQKLKMPGGPTAIICSVKIWSVEVHCTAIVAQCFSALCDRNNMTFSSESRKQEVPNVSEDRKVLAVKEFYKKFSYHWQVVLSIIQEASTLLQSHLTALPGLITYKLPCEIRY